MPRRANCSRGDGHPASLAGNAALRWSLLSGVACNDAAVEEDDGEHWAIAGDPTEAALIIAAAKAGLPARRVTAELRRVAAIPFSSERQYMATLHVDDRGDHVVLVKGSVERVLGMCRTEMAADGSLRPVNHRAALAAADRLAAAGLRVLACGVATDRMIRTRFADGEVNVPVTLTGLQAMLDPPRPAAAASVAACRRAGISVKMITGDHAGTARAIAVSVGILDQADTGPDAVLTGADLAAIPAEDLPEAVEHACVFARVSPEQKLRLVQAFRPVVTSSR